MILLLILYFLSAYSHGITSPVAPSIHPNESPSLFVRDTDIPDLSPRKRVEIIWSCLATILAASWVAVHPNMPDPQDSSLKKILRRVELMLWAIITPEFIIFWAMAQWDGARLMEREFSVLALQHTAAAIKEGTYTHQMENIDEDYIGYMRPLIDSLAHGDRATALRLVEDKFRWTKTHGFFLQMGGFVLKENGKRKTILGWKKLLELYTAGKIDLSDITEARINDHSKADWFAKSLALIQTAWFIVLCLARFLDGNLVLTQLELVTSALAVMSLVMYFLWWNKPFNAEIPIVIAVSDPALGTLTKTSVQDYQDEGEGQAHLMDLKNDLSMFQRIWNRVGEILGRAHLMDLVKNVLSMFPRILNRIREIIGLGYVTLRDPIDNQRSPITKVPTFYALRIGSIRTGYQVLWAISFIASLFGAIHCAGWSTMIYFSSHTASILWRSASLIIATTPVLWTSFYFCFRYAPNYVDALHGYGRLSKWVDYIEDEGFLILSILIVCLYIPSRVILLIIAIIELRHAPPEALANIQWANSIPFIH